MFIEAILLLSTGCNLTLLLLSFLQLFDYTLMQHPVSDGVVNREGWSILWDVKQVPESNTSSFIFSYRDGFTWRWRREDKMNKGSVSFSLGNICSWSVINFSQVFY